MYTKNDWKKHYGRVYKTRPAETTSMVGSNQQSIVEPDGIIRLIHDFNADFALSLNSYETVYLRWVLNLQNGNPCW